MSTQNQIRDVLNRHYDHPSQKLAFKACLDDLTNLFKEERRAAWADAVQIAKEEAFERRLAHTVYERLIEAAANETREDESHGPQA